MAKLVGGVLVCLGVLLVGASIISILISIVPSVAIILSNGTAYAWGRLIGGIVATVLFLLLGLKALKSGRRRIAGSKAGTSNA